MQSSVTPADFAVRYQQMTDEELLRLSSDTGSLVVEAQMALSAELQRRHLDSQETRAQFQEEEKRHIAEVSFDVSSGASIGLHYFKKRPYGKADRQKRGTEEEYDTTLFGVVFHFPLLPLGTFRVVRDLNSKHLRALEKKPLRWSQVWFTWFKAVVVVVAIISLLAWLVSLDKY